MTQMIHLLHLKQERPYVPQIIQTYLRPPYRPYLILLLKVMYGPYLKTLTPQNILIIMYMKQKAAIYLNLTIHQTKSVFYNIIIVVQKQKSRPQEQKMK